MGPDSGRTQFYSIICFMSQRIYLDNAATTPLDGRVIDSMREVMESQFGNPSSIHAEGRQARALIEQARKTVANCIGASIGEIFFTSGGTESNNMALKCAVRDLGVERIISSPIEHHCVLHTLERLEKEQGIEVDFVAIDSHGRVNLEHLEELLKTSDKKSLVSLMHSNNEVGTLLPLEEVGNLCAEYQVYFHSDTVQTVGYFPINVEAAKISFLSGSAHKFYGPKGIGFIYINGDNIIQPYLDGGAQERNMRAGTENIYGIVGLAKALGLACEEMEERRSHILNLKAYLAEKIMVLVPEAKVNGTLENSHFKVLNISFPPSPKTDLLLLNFDIAGISVSGGSACSSGADVGSHVIENLDGQPGWKAIRFSFSHKNTLEELDKVVEVVSKIFEPQKTM